MKTFNQKIFVGFAIVLLASCTVAKAESTPVKSTYIKLRNEIIKQIGFPEQIKNVSGKKVRVNFEINKEGKPALINVDSEDAQIKAFVKHEFETMKLTDSLTEVGGCYNIDIQFSVK